MGSWQPLKRLVKDSFKKMRWWDGKSSSKVPVTQQNCLHFNKRGNWGIQRRCQYSKKKKIMITWLNHDIARTSALTLYFINQTSLPWKSFVITTGESISVGHVKHQACPKVPCIFSSFTPCTNYTASSKLANMVGTDTGCCQDKIHMCNVMTQFPLSVGYPF